MIVSRSLVHIFLTQNKKLKQQLEEEKEKSSLAAEKYASTPKAAQKENGPDVAALEMQSKFLITCGID
jgi:hypothetical protein